MLIRSVMSIASSFVKRIGEMVNFKLSKEIQKDVFFVLSRVRDNTLKDVHCTYKDSIHGVFQFVMHSRNLGSVGILI